MKRLRDSELWNIRSGVRVQCVNSALSFQLLDCLWNLIWTEKHGQELVEIVTQNLRSAYK